MILIFFILNFIFIFFFFSSRRRHTRLQGDWSSDVCSSDLAFATPTIVHFGVVLLLSAVVSVPWHKIGTVSVVWGLVGLSGIVYAVIVSRRTRVQTIYQPVFEDWLFHVLFPFAAYAMLAGSAYVAHSHARPALFVVGAATLLLLFVGIHNAWDAVTYHVLVKKREQGEAERHG